MFLGIKFRYGKFGDNYDSYECLGVYKTNLAKENEGVEYFVELTPEVVKEIIDIDDRDH